jgi:hypothetical protein
MASAAASPAAAEKPTLEIIEASLRHSLPVVEGRPPLYDLADAVRRAYQLTPQPQQVQDELEKLKGLCPFAYYTIDIEAAIGLLREGKVQTCTFPEHIVTFEEVTKENASTYKALHHIQCEPGDFVLHAYPQDWGQRDSILPLSKEEALSLKAQFKKLRETLDPSYD